jgi:hypothetical protein
MSFQAWSFWARSFQAQSVYRYFFHLKLVTNVADQNSLKRYRSLKKQFKSVIKLQQSYSDDTIKALSVAFFGVVDLDPGRIRIQCSLWIQIRNPGLDPVPGVKKRRKLFINIYFLSKIFKLFILKSIWWSRSRIALRLRLN